MIYSRSFRGKNKENKLLQPKLLRDVGNTAVVDMSTIQKVCNPKSIVLKILRTQSKIIVTTECSGFMTYFPICSRGTNICIICGHLNGVVMYVITKLIGARRF